MSHSICSVEFDAAFKNRLGMYSQQSWGGTFGTLLKHITARLVKSHALSRMAAISSWGRVAAGTQRRRAQWNLELTHSAKVRNSLCIHPVIQIHSEIKQALSWPMLHLSTKFHANWATIFCAILQTNKPTNQTKNMTSLANVIKQELQMNGTYKQGGKANNEWEKGQVGKAGQVSHRMSWFKFYSPAGCQNIDYIQVPGGPVQ